MTRAEIRARILDLVNEPQTPVFYAEAELHAIIDEAAEVVCEESGAVKRTSYVALDAGRTYYSIHSLGREVMAPWRLWMPGAGSAQYRRLHACSMSELDAVNATWPETTGDPWYWFPVSWDLFGLYPRMAAGGGQLRVDYLAWPEPSDDDLSEPEMLEGDHDALVLYGAYDAAMKRWDTATGLQAFALFLQRFRQAKGRSTVGRVQSRAFQVGEAGTNGFTTGVAY